MVERDESVTEDIHGPSSQGEIRVSIHPMKRCVQMIAGLQAWRKTGKEVNPYLGAEVVCGQADGSFSKWWVVGESRKTDEVGARLWRALCRCRDCGLDSKQQGTALVAKGG